jgi:hypothetical protein
MDLDDRGQQPRFLLHDRDKKFNRSFDAIFQAAGIRLIRTGSASTAPDLRRRIAAAEPIHRRRPPFIRCRSDAATCSAACFTNTKPA